MPLESGSSKAAFSHNVEIEMKEGGKPQKQAVAIAYSKARGDTFGESDEYNLGYADATAGLPSSGEIGVESDYNRGYESGRVAGDRKMRTDATYMANAAKLDVALAKAVKMDAEKIEFEVIGEQRNGSPLLLQIFAKDNDQAKYYAELQGMMRVRAVNAKWSPESTRRRVGGTFGT